MRHTYITGDGGGAKIHLKHVACYTYHAEIDDHLSIFPHNRMGSGQWRVQGQKPPQTLKLCSAIQTINTRLNVMTV